MGGSVTKLQEFTFEDLSEKKQILAFSKLNFSSLGYLDYDDLYYINQDYYSNIHSASKMLKNREEATIYQIDKDNNNLRLLIRKNGKVLFDKEIKKKSYKESIELIGNIYETNRRRLGLANSRIRRKKNDLNRLLQKLESFGKQTRKTTSGSISIKELKELQEKSNSSEPKKGFKIPLRPGKPKKEFNSKDEIEKEIEKTKIELVELKKKKEEAIMMAKQLLPQLQEEKKSQKLEEYEKIIINNIDLINREDIRIITPELITYDYSNFDKSLLNTDSELKFEKVEQSDSRPRPPSSEVEKQENRYNVAFCYYIKDYLPKDKIYYIKNEGGNDAKFSIIKDNKLKSYRGGSLETFINKNYKDQTLYIVNYLDNNNKRSLKSKNNRSINKEESSYFTSDLLLPLIAGYLFFKNNK